MELTKVFYECCVSISKTLENGTNKKVKETYYVKSDNVVNAESLITEEMKIYSDFEVLSVKKKNGIEVLNATGDIWYIVKIACVLIDEKSGSEKTKFFCVLVNAADFKAAANSADEFIKNCVLCDCRVYSVSETKIMDVFM